jgi:hypothetical protein
MLATTVTTRARRLPIVLGTLSLVAAVWAPTRAGAEQSPPTAFQGTVIFEAGTLCSFDVKLDFQGKTATLQLPNGTRIVTIATFPTATATVTNLDTGEQVDLKIPGPVQTLATTGEAVFVGPSLVLRSPDFGDNTTALVYVTGRFTFLPGRLPSPFSGVGNLTDVCAVLA